MAKELSINAIKANLDNILLDFTLIGLTESNVHQILNNTAVLMTIDKLLVAGRNYTGRNKPAHRPKSFLPIAIVEELTDAIVSVVPVRENIYTTHISFYNGIVIPLYNYYLNFQQLAELTNTKKKEESIQFSSESGSLTILMLLYRLSPNFKTVPAETTDKFSKTLLGLVQDRDLKSLNKIITKYGFDDMFDEKSRADLEYRLKQRFSLHSKKKFKYTEIANAKKI